MGNKFCLQYDEIEHNASARAKTTEVMSDMHSMAGDRDSGREITAHHLCQHKSKVKKRNWIYQEMSLHPVNNQTEGTVC